MELRGRRGLILPIIAALLLIPASLLPGVGTGQPEAPSLMDLWPGADGPVRTGGEVPDELAQVPGVQVVTEPPYNLYVQETDQGRIVHGDPSPVRAALDGEGPAVRVHHTGFDLAIPGRSMLLALVAASTLTGAVSTSIAGERSRKTLIALLSAAIKRGTRTAIWLAERF